MEGKKRLKKKRKGADQRKKNKARPNEKIERIARRCYRIEAL